MLDYDEYLGLSHIKDPSHLHGFPVLRITLAVMMLAGPGLGHGDDKHGTLRDTKVYVLQNGHFRRANNQVQQSWETQITSGNRRQLQADVLPEC